MNCVKTLWNTWPGFRHVSCAEQREIPRYEVEISSDVWRSVWHGQSSLAHLYRIRSGRQPGKYNFFMRAIRRIYARKFMFSGKPAASMGNPKVSTRKGGSRNVPDGTGAEPASLPTVPQPERDFLISFIAAFCPLQPLSLIHISEPTRR